MTALCKECDYVHSDTRKLETKVCAHCGTTFERGDRKTWQWNRQRFCSNACGHMTKARRPGSLVRLMENVIPEPNSGCWLWMGTMTNDGYGTVMVERRKMRAHRLSLEIHKGPIPDGMLVRHKCDTPLCVNPDHLEYGTVKDNSSDAIARGRLRRGSEHHASKINEAVVSEILADQRNNSAIAREHGISRTAVYSIKAGKTWTHIERTRNND